MNDLTQPNTKIAPVTASISLDVPATTFAKGPPSAANPRKKSNPPRKAKRPKMTAMCIQSLLRAELILASRPEISIGAPIIAGIQEVMDSDSKTIEKKVAHTIKNIPYAAAKFGISAPMKVNLSSIFLSLMLFEDDVIG